MSASSPRLVARFGPLAKQEYKLPQQAVTLGREAINEIVVNDPEVSRRHARISFEGGRYLIEDLGSTNGTFVNGRRLSGSTPLADGDVIDLGDVASLTFRGQVMEAGATLVDASLEPDHAATVLEHEAAPDDRALDTPVVPPVDAPVVPPPVFTQPEPEPKAPPSPMAMPEAEEPASDRRWSTRQAVFGIGCLLFVAAAVCASAVFLADRFAADALYCGPLQPLFEFLGMALACG